MLEKNKYCCDEHTDLAFDDFINNYETFPYIEEISEKKCDYCSSNAKYILKSLSNSGPSDLL